MSNKRHTGRCSTGCTPAGLLASGPELVRLTPLSQHAGELCMTIFAISKDQTHERLISWPRQANELAPYQLKPEFSNPKHFGYAMSAAGRWSGF